MSSHIKYAKEKELEESMDFEINSEQKTVLESARRFIEREVDPYIREQKLRKDLVRKMGQQGFLGSAFPARYGGTKVYQIGEGTANIMRLIIADDALGFKKANRPRIKTKVDIQDFS